MNTSPPSEMPGLALEGRVLRMTTPAVKKADVERMPYAQRRDVDLIIINVTTVSLGVCHLRELLVDGRGRRFDRARGIYIYGAVVPRSDLIAALMFYTGVRFLGVNVSDMPYLVADLELGKRPSLAELWVPLSCGGACQRAAVAKCGGPSAPVVRYFVGEAWNNAPPEAYAADPVVAAFERLCPVPLEPAPHPAPKDSTTLSHTGGTVTLCDSTETLVGDPATYTFVGVADPGTGFPAPAPLPPVLRDPPRMPALRGLSLAFRRVDAATLVAILDMAPNLVFLDLRGALDGAGLEALIKHRHKLERLYELWVTNDVATKEELKRRLTVGALRIRWKTSRCWDHPPPECSMVARLTPPESMGHTAFRRRFAAPPLRPRICGAPSVVVETRQDPADRWTDVGTAVLYKNSPTNWIDTILEATRRRDHVRLVILEVAHDADRVHNLLEGIYPSWFVKWGRLEMVFVAPARDSVLGVGTLSLLTQVGHDADITLRVADRDLPLAAACAERVAIFRGFAKPQDPTGVDCEKVLAAGTEGLPECMVALYEWVRRNRPSPDAAVAEARGRALRLRGRYRLEDMNGIAQIWEEGVALILDNVDLDAPTVSLIGGFIRKCKCTNLVVCIDDSDVARNDVLGVVRGQWFDRIEIHGYKGSNPDEVMAYIGFAERIGEVRLVGTSTALFYAAGRILPSTVRLVNVGVEVHIDGKTVPVPPGVVNVHASRVMGRSLLHTLSIRDAPAAGGLVVATEQPLSSEESESESSDTESESSDSESESSDSESEASDSEYPEAEDAAMSGDEDAPSSPDPMPNLPPDQPRQRSFFTTLFW